MKVWGERCNEHRAWGMRSKAVPKGVMVKWDVGWIGKKGRDKVREHWSKGCEDEADIERKTEVFDMKRQWQW